jgi:hypothetical protein
MSGFEHAAAVLTDLDVLRPVGGGLLSARCTGHTHDLYAFAWCETDKLDSLIGIQRAHVELYIRQLGVAGLMDSSVTTMMHGVRGSARGITTRR